GERVVNILPILHDELDAYLARLDRAPCALAFATTTGAMDYSDNVRRDTLRPAVEKANEMLARDYIEPLPDGLTPHSLRRTYASVLFAVGEDAAYVMQQMGHVTPKEALATYAKVMQRRDGEAERLKALVGAEVEGFGQQIGDEPDLAEAEMPIR